MSVGVWVLIVAVVATVGIGLFRANVDGRFRGTHPIRDVADRGETAPTRPAQNVLALAGPDLDLGERATLLQFSSAFCAPCRATRRVLTDVAALVPGVRHHEVDAEHHLDLVRNLGVLRTPTTLVLDARGVEVSRASGAPTKEQVLATLGAIV